MVENLRAERADRRCPQQTMRCGGGGQPARRTFGPRSTELFARARRVLPDGTTRVTIERDPVPRYFSHGRSAYVYDVDGKPFLDLYGNYTTLINGHAFEPVIRAVEQQLRSGACFANPTESEIALADPAH